MIPRISGCTQLPSLLPWDNHLVRSQWVTAAQFQAPVCYRLTPERGPCKVPLLAAALLLVRKKMRAEA